MKKSIALAGGLLFWVSVAYAQPYVSIGGRFQVDEVKGCAPFTVTLTNLLAGNCDAANPCAMDYEGNNQQALNLFTYTYTTPGVYTLRVLYQGQGSDEITITVVENIEPDFEIYSCANADVTIKVLEKAYQQLVIDFTNDGVPETIIPSGNNALAAHNYAAPGPQTISVRGRNLNSADNCDSKVQTFDALATLPAPSIDQLIVLDPNNIQLDFTTAPHIQYRLEIAVNGSTNFQQLNTLYEPSTITIPNLKPEENFYCFRLGAYDACNSTSNYSNIICSTDLSLNIESAVNRLNWSTGAAGIQSIEIERNDDTYIIIPGTPSSFNDVDIICKTDYCYRIINRYANGVTSRSLQYCGTSFKLEAPPPIVNTSAMVSTDGADLEWIQDPASSPPSYMIFRSVEGLPFSALASPVITSYLDVNYTTQSNFNYRIDYTDECGNKSPEGLVIKPLQLTGSIDKNIITLQWSAYEGWQNGVDHYVLEKYDQEGNLFQSLDLGIDLSYVDDEADPVHQLIRYRIRAVASDAGLTPSTSNTLTFIKDSMIFAPNAFSPNGDKLNDTFVVSGQFIVSMELTIFNRWGELIFITDKKDQPWDGTFNGKQLAEDAYIWSVEVTDLAGRTYKESGTIAILNRGK